MISVDPLRENNILYLSVLKDEIDFDPSYQRDSDIWPLSKKQLFIDSLLNNIDIPKIYFHEVKKTGSYPYKYAVVDGKQRLETIFSFLNDEFCLSDSIEDFSGEGRDLRGKKYSQLIEFGLKYKANFDAKQLPIYVIRTEEHELIDEMFFRLNEAAPLNAAEKRNSFGGPYPIIIRELVEHDFFKKKVPFSDKRFKHHDVLGKMLLLSYNDKVVDTKKIHLDNFARMLNDEKSNVVNEIKEKVKNYLDFSVNVFQDKDKLLKSTGIIPVHYLAYLNIDDRLKFSRESLDKFENARARNRELAKNDELSSEIDYDLLEFDRLVQSPNDSSSIEFRLEKIMEFLE